MRIALVGNQNSGKTTLFNALTGMNQKIGNWPGVTVEKKEGVIKGTDHTLIDLPGIYSLSPYTTEEKIACEYLLSEKPDAIINIIDAVSLERSLYLTLQLLELDIPVIVALNMTDILIKKGGRIDAQKLSELLGVEVAMLSARRRVGVGELIAKVLEKPAKKTRFRYSERSKSWFGSRGRASRGKRPVRRGEVIGKRPALRRPRDARGRENFARPQGRGF